MEAPDSIDPVAAPRRGKPGLKKYLLARLRYVKEVFRKELDAKTPRQCESEKTSPVIVDTSPPLPPEEPPSFPELPEPRQADYNEVLRVSDQALDVTPSVITTRYGNKKVQWTTLPMRRVRKVLEICTWTMMISTIALEQTNKMWKTCTPVSIEHGFDLLTPEGRRKGEEYIHREAGPDNW